MLYLVNTNLNYFTWYEVQCETLGQVFVKSLRGVYICICNTEFCQGLSFIVIIYIKTTLLVTLDNMHKIRI